MTTNDDDGVWEDVTELFAEAKLEMNLGQLVHDADFNLYSAMSAVELMDKKMDCGMDQSWRTSVKERLLSGFLQSYC